MRVCADIAAKWAIAEQTGQMLATTPPRITVRWLAHPPPIIASDNDHPMLELKADVGDDDSDRPQ